MRRSNRGVVAGLMMAGVLPLACNEKLDPVRTSLPARVERQEGATVSRVILSARAAERLDIQTAPIRDAGTTQRTVIPYSALIYDLHGDTWAYTNPAPLTFVRQRIRVDRIDADVALLSDGPPVGTAVVTVGAAELFGIEFGVGK